jgi:hypothetical protein
VRHVERMTERGVDRGRLCLRDRKVRAPDLAERDGPAFADPRTREVERGAMEVERGAEAHLGSRAKKVDGVGGHDRVDHDSALLPYAVRERLGDLELSTIIVDRTRDGALVVLSGQEEVGAAAGSKASRRRNPFPRGGEVAVVVDDR